MSAADAPPALSVGLAVRNDPQGVRRCIESVLFQDFTDIELVIRNNASEDDTVNTLDEYAREDRRVSVVVNPVSIGSYENMNRVLELSSGTCSAGSAPTTGSSRTLYRKACGRSIVTPTRSAPPRCSPFTHLAWRHYGIYLASS
jgi:hypothetical protein